MTNDFRSNLSRGIIRRSVKQVPVSKDTLDSHQGNKAHNLLRKIAVSSTKIPRKFSEFKRFQTQKAIQENSYYNLNKSYSKFLMELRTKLNKSFKYLPISRCATNYEDLQVNIKCKDNVFIRSDNEGFLRSCLIKTIGICNTLIEEEEFEIRSIIESIDMRASHTTDEVMVIFNIKKDYLCGIENKLSRTDIIALKTLVFRLRDLGSNITSSYYNFQSNLIKITGTDGLRESITAINLELKPYSEFEINPTKSSDILRRFEQLIGYGNNQIMWDLECGYGLTTLSALRAGFIPMGFSTTSCFDNIACNMDLNKDFIPDSFLSRKKELILTGSEQDLLIPPDFNFPGVIVLHLNNKVSDHMFRLILCGISQVLDSRLFVYSNSFEYIEDISLKLKAYSIELKQLEAYQLLSSKESLKMCAIYTKQLDLTRT